MPDLSSLIRGKEALGERVSVRMSLDSGSNENIPNHVIYTPQDSLQDETSSVGTVTMEGERPDNRPNTSPYTTPIFYLIIGPSNVQYPIHQHFLDQSPEWAKKCRSKPWGNKIRLLDVDEDDSHALVHYLYTGAYQTLKPSYVSAVASDNTTDLEGRGKVPKIDRLLEYKRSVRLYCIAKTYGLFHLETLCMKRIERFKDNSSIWDTLDIAEEAYKKLTAGAIWFSMYLREEIQAAINDDKHFLIRKKFLGRIGKTTEFDKALMKIIGQIYIGGNEPEKEHEDNTARNETSDTKLPSDGEKTSTEKSSPIESSP